MINKKEIIRAIKYTIIALSAGAIQLGSFALFQEVFGWIHWVSYLVSLVLSVIWNFTINRKYTFKSANNVPIAMLKLACFYLVFTPLSTLATNYLNETAHWNSYLVQCLVMFVNFVSEFFYQRLFVFGKEVDTAVK